MEMLNYEKLFSLKRIMKVSSRNFVESFSFHLAFWRSFSKHGLGRDWVAGHSIKIRESVPKFEVKKSLFSWKRLDWRIPPAIQHIFRVTELYFTSIQ